MKNLIKMSMVLLVSQMIISSNQNELEIPRFFDITTNLSTTILGRGRFLQGRNEDECKKTINAVYNNLIEGGVSPQEIGTLVITEMHPNCPQPILHIPNDSATRSKTFSVSMNGGTIFFDCHYNYLLSSVNQNH